MITYTLETTAKTDPVRGKEIDEAFALSAAKMGKSPESWLAELETSLEEWRAS